MQNLAVAPAWALNMYSSEDAIPMVDEQSRSQLGFKFGLNGAHAARSMMLEELKLLFAGRPADAEVADYQRDIVEFNVLHKTSENARKLTFRHLVDLYGLSPSIPLFRVFRQLWELSEAAQPLLCLQMALARDPLLRGSMEVILPLQLGELLTREQMEAHLAGPNPDRFSPASLKSFSQNINGSWTQAGYLSGKAKKYRGEPKVTYVNVAFALFQASCEGFSGQRLFTSSWCKLLGKDLMSIYDLAQSASLRGLINFKHAGEIVEVTFPNLKTA